MELRKGCNAHGSGRPDGGLRYRNTDRVIVQGCMLGC